MANKRIAVSGNSQSLEETNGDKKYLDIVTIMIKLAAGLVATVNTKTTIKASNLLYAVRM